ncbi:MAG: phage major capsid protein [Clostridia bacterium]
MLKPYMNEQETRQVLASTTTRARELLDAGRTEEAKPLLEDMKECRARLAAMEKADNELRAMQAAEARMPPPASAASEARGWADIRQALLEKRAITSGGAGQNTVPGIVSALVDGGRLVGKVSKFYGRNSVTNVPVMAPTLALPVGSVPGATGTASDSTAVLAGDALTLKPWYSTLPVSMDALISTDIERELPGIFAKAFGGSIDKLIIAGTGGGSDGLGVFVASASGVPVASDISVAAAGTPKWVDLSKLALTILGLGGDQQSLVIVMNPLIMAPLLAESTTGVDPFKVEFLTKGTILGIPVILSGYAPSATVAGSYVAVGGDFSHYAWAVAQELTIDPIKTVGSDNVTFQSFMYMQGKPLIGSSFRRLKTV